MRVALKLNITKLTHAVLGEIVDKAQALQLCFMLGRQRVNFESDDVTELMPKIDNTGDSEEEHDDFIKNLSKIISNEKVSFYFKTLAK